MPEWRVGVEAVVGSHGEGDPCAKSVFVVGLPGGLEGADKMRSHRDASVPNLRDCVHEGFDIVTPLCTLKIRLGVIHPWTAIRTVGECQPR
jgi:hypothetical protein